MSTIDSRKDRPRTRERRTRWDTDTRNQVVSTKNEKTDELPELNEEEYDEEWEHEWEDIDEIESPHLKQNRYPAHGRGGRGRGGHMRGRLNQNSYKWDFKSRREGGNSPERSSRRSRSGSAYEMEEEENLDMPPGEEMTNLKVKIQDGKRFAEPDEGPEFGLSEARGHSPFRGRFNRGRVSRGYQHSSTRGSRGGWNSRDAQHQFSNEEDLVDCREVLNRRKRLHSDSLECDLREKLLRRDAEPGDLRDVLVSKDSVALDLRDIIEPPDLRLIDEFQENSPRFIEQESSENINQRSPRRDLYDTEDRNFRGRHEEDIERGGHFERSREEYDRRSEERWLPEFESEEDRRRSKVSRLEEERCPEDWPSDRVSWQGEDRASPERRFDEVRQPSPPEHWADRRESPGRNRDDDWNMHQVPELELSRGQGRARSRDLDRERGASGSRDRLRRREPQWEREMGRSASRDRDDEHLQARAASFGREVQRSGRGARDRSSDPERRRIGAGERVVDMDRERGRVVLINTEVHGERSRSRSIGSSGRRPPWEVDGRGRSPPRSASRERIRTPPRERVRSPLRGRVRSPPRDRGRSPPRERIRSPPRERIRSPPRERVRSPPRERVRSPPRDRVRSPPRERIRSPPRDRVRSPPRERIRSPPRERIRSPHRERIRSPPRERIRSPPRDRVRSPPRERIRSPPRERARSPLRERLRSPLRERVRSPPRERLRTPPRERIRSPLPERPRSPPRERAIINGLEREIARARERVNRESEKIRAQEQLRSASREADRIKREKSSERNKRSQERNRDPNHLVPRALIHPLPRGPSHPMPRDVGREANQSQDRDKIRKRDPEENSAKERARERIRSPKVHDTRMKYPAPVGIQNAHFVKEEQRFSRENQKQDKFIKIEATSKSERRLTSEDKRGNFHDQNVSEEWEKIRDFQERRSNYQPGSLPFLEESRKKFESPREERPGGDRGTREPKLPFLDDQKSPPSHDPGRSWLSQSARRPEQRVEEDRHSIPSWTSSGKKERERRPQGGAREENVSHKPGLSSNTNPINSHQTTANDNNGECWQRRPYTSGGDPHWDKPRSDLDPSRPFVPKTHQLPNEVVFVRGLARDVTEMDIRKDISDCRLWAKDVRVVIDGESGLSRGLAFITFNSVDEATRWIELRKGALNLRQNNHAPMDYSNPTSRDWECTRCHTMNFRHRTACHLCGRVKEDCLDGWEEASPYPTNALLLRGINPSTSTADVIKNLKSRGTAASRLDGVTLGKDVNGRARPLCFVQLTSVVDSIALHKSLLNEPLILDGQQAVVAYCQLDKLPPMLETFGTRVTPQTHSRLPATLPPNLTSGLPLNLPTVSPSPNIPLVHRAPMPQALKGLGVSTQAIKSMLEGNYTEKDIPILAQYCAAAYAKNPQEQVAYANYYTKHYKERLNKK